MRRRRAHLRLPLDAERVGEAHEVAEDAHHVRGADDRLLVVSMRAQSLDVGVHDLVGRQRQFLRVLAERAVARLDRCGAEVGLDLLDQVGGGVFETEKLSVNLRSIATLAGA